MVALYRLTLIDLEILYPQVVVFGALKGLLKYPILNINLFVILYKFATAAINTIAKKVFRLFFATSYSLYSS